MVLLAIKFPELDQQGRLAVWCKFLELAGYDVIPKAEVASTSVDEKLRFAKEDLEALALKEFNGKFCET